MAVAGKDCGYETKHLRSEPGIHVRASHWLKRMKRVCVRFSPWLYTVHGSFTVTCYTTVP